MNEELYDSLELFESPEAYFAAPRGKHDGEKALRIDRLRGSMQLVDESQYRNAWRTTPSQIYGIFGLIQLIGSYYLIVITQIEHVCDLLEKRIYRIAKLEVLQCSPSLSHFNESQRMYNEQYLGMLRLVTSLPYFYFSYGYDLSHAMQNLIIAEPDFYRKTLFQRANKEFVWNGAILHDLTRDELARFCIPVIHGFMDAIGSRARKTFTVVLISRRSTHRAGTRMHVRGADQQGNVANFVETEQIVLCDEYKASFVITRGSIPLVWSQKPDLRYKPPPKLATNVDQIQVLQAHAHKMYTSYGQLMMINLINQTGAEGVLFHSLQGLLNSIPGLNMIDLINFDFHEVCKHDRWDNLRLLLTKIENLRQESGYLSIHSHDRIVRRQEGVFRVNCIDSLDRTNVVQSLIARTMLTEQLLEFGALKQTNELQANENFDFLFRRIWADNADVLSTQYAGTGALKSDYTRTGKRRFVGKLQDGVNALTRYYKNNFEDGFKQDSIDLLLGKYQVTPTEALIDPCPLAERTLKIFAIPLMLLLVLVLFFLSDYLPFEAWLTLYACFIILLFSGYLFYFHGEQFVDKPQLVRSDRPSSSLKQFHL